MRHGRRSSREILFGSRLPITTFIWCGPTTGLKNSFKQCATKVANDIDDSTNRIFRSVQALPSERLAKRHGQPMEISAWAYDILVILLSQPNEVIRKKTYSRGLDGSSTRTWGSPMRALACETH